MTLGICTQCKQDTARLPDGGLYVEWSDRETVEGNGCVAEMFCSWNCAAHWFCTQADQDLHSKLLLPDVRLTSKLLDGTFPDYQRIVPTSYDCSVTADRAELGAALARVEATLNPETRKLMRTVGLAWGDGALHVTRLGADVDDVLDAETSSAGKTALRISYVADVLDVFSGKCISIASKGAGTPIRFADPADPTAFAIVMPIRSAL
jgi:DNA polymerase III sliding clamp (beta) subunit (PCNA family)